MAKLEYEKKELFLGLNEFNRPKYAEKVEAWITLIRQLLYTRKGSYPSCPELGVDLHSYEFEFMDIAIRSIQKDILDQVHTYLPDIPLTNVELKEKQFPDRADPILLIILIFIVSGDYVPAALAINKSNRIDFEVSM